MTTTVVINGVNGRMGQTAKATIQNHPEFVLIGEATRATDLTALLAELKPSLVIDFTSPDCVYKNCQTIIAVGAHPVIGTTGLKEFQIQELIDQCAQRQLGGIIAPNFSLAAILMMQFAKSAVKYLPNVEIIELHDSQKKDAPSGTAIKTAQMIAAHRPRSAFASDSSPAKLNIENEKKHDPENTSRGLLVDNIPVHAIRLPGFLAHQRVIFGEYGESLTIQHDAIHRKCYMEGMILACQKVLTLQTLVYGLENILEI